MSDNSLITISTYHEYLLEAIVSLQEGLSRKGIEGEIFSRYSFLLISNSLEAAANALLLSLDFEKDYYEELEKLGTLTKFKTFCKFKNKTLPIGDIKFARIKDIISCRNEFVHPKPKRVDFIFDKGIKDYAYKTIKTKNRNYPLYFSEIKPLHVLTALDDALTFIAWICFDICKLKIKEGALMLGFGSCSWTGDITTLSLEYNLSLDQRSFGKSK
ncbi:MAG: hypothetical protein U0V75_17890 [Ferruginibacter sp.]